MAKKHDINMLHAWAKSWGIKGYEYLDPQLKEKNKQHALKRALYRERQEARQKFFKKK